MKNIGKCGRGGIGDVFIYIRWLGNVVYENYIDFISEIGFLFFLFL